MTLQTEKITKIDYRLIPNTTVAEYGLVSEVRVKDGSTNFLQKKSTTAYNLSTAYVSRRILGLPSKTVSWGYDQSNSQLEKVSEVDCFYDEGDFSDTSLEQNIANVIMHDTGNYGASFTVGRGNLSSIRYTKSAIRSPTYWVLVSVILKIQSISTREWRWKGA